MVRSEREGEGCSLLRGEIGAVIGEECFGRPIGVVELSQDVDIELCLDSSRVGDAQLVEGFV